MLTGCALAQEQPDVIPAPAPTVLPLFGADEPEVVEITEEPSDTIRIEPTAAALGQDALAITPIAVSANGQNSVLSAADANFREVYIFADQLDPNWNLTQSYDMAYDLQDSSHWFDLLDPAQDIDSGALSIAVTPQKDFGSLYFTVGPDALESYQNGKVVGISFWLNGGNEFLDTEALAISVVGSNSSPTWSENDNPIQEDGEALYSETRLYFLDLNRSIPPNTWVQVVVMFQKLVYDPEFEYLTGFYIKNDEGYRNTFFIDNVATIWQVGAIQ